MCKRLGLKHDPDYEQKASEAESDKHRCKFCGYRFKSDPNKINVMKVIPGDVVVWNNGNVALIVSVNTTNREVTAFVDGITTKKRFPIIHDEFTKVTNEH